MIKRALVILAAALLLGSCATYTAREGYQRISIPETTGHPSTKYATILQENQYKTEEAIENSRKAAEHRAAMKREAEVNEYPEDLSMLTYPHVYTPKRTNSTAPDGITVIKVLMLPLGYEPLTVEDAERILGANSDITPDFVILTGSLENQVLGAKTAGWDAVTMEGGTVLHRPLLKEARESSSSFFITATKDIEIAPLSFEASMPSDENQAEAWAIALTDDESELAKVTATAEAMSDREKILAISSSQPSGEDWIEFTPFRYRSDLDFPVSSYLEENDWLDTYRASHFTAETDGGTTRKLGNVYERLDFLYTQGLVPVSAISYPVMGLTDRTGTFAVLAEILVP